jgi:hypothetical protein
MVWVERRIWLVGGSGDFEVCPPLVPAFNAGSFVVERNRPFQLVGSRQPTENGDMQPTDELANDLFRERVLRAREMAPEAKLTAGPELFSYAAQITASGIRHQFPEATEEQVQAMLDQRLRLRQRLEATPWT